MLSCKEVTRLASESLDRDLSFKEHVAMKLHLMMCRMCQRYSKQLKFIAFVTKKLSTEEDEINRIPGLSKEAGKRINKKITQEQQGQINS